MNLPIAVRQLFLENRQYAKSFQYTVPSLSSYPYQWLWDSCFNAIVLSHFNTEDAKKELISLVSKQFKNGMIPHMIYWKNHPKTSFPKITWGKKNTSTLTQPPMLAYAVWQIFQKDQDANFLETIYPSLDRFYKYLITERDPYKKHLVGIVNPDESGEDNSPRFDELLNLPVKQTRLENRQKRLELVQHNIKCNFNAPFYMRNFFWVNDVPFNSIMITNLKLLARIAKQVGKKEDAAYFIKEANKITFAMKKFMLEKGIFWSIQGKTYKKIKIKTWAIFSPLFAQIVSQKEASDLVNKHLLNKNEFWTNFPVPTVALNEKPFDPAGFWRGPTWIGTNWFIYQGLKNYGFENIAAEIKHSSIALLQKSGFREYFNPFTGEGLGAQNFTWGGLILDMN